MALRFQRWLSSPTYTTWSFANGLTTWSRDPYAYRSGEIVYDCRPLHSTRPRTKGRYGERLLLDAMQGAFKPSKISNVLYTLALAGVTADLGLLELIQRQAMAAAGQFTPHDAAKMLWALASMGVIVDRGLLAAMQKRMNGLCREARWSPMLGNIKT